MNSSTTFHNNFLHVSNQIVWTIADSVFSSCSLSYKFKSSLSKNYNGAEKLSRPSKCTAPIRVFHYINSLTSCHTHARIKLESSYSSRNHSTPCHTHARIEPESPYLAKIIQPHANPQATIVLNQSSRKFSNQTSSYNHSTSSQNFVNEAHVIPNP
jgi:hypothetical protein